MKSHVLLKVVPGYTKHWRPRLGFKSSSDDDEPRPRSFVRTILSRSSALMSRGSRDPNMTETGDKMAIPELRGWRLDELDFAGVRGCDAMSPPPAVPIGSTLAVFILFYLVWTSAVAHYDIQIETGLEIWVGRGSHFADWVHLLAGPAQGLMRKYHA